MKVYRGVVKGNTIILEEKPDLPDECPALVEIKPLDKNPRRGDNPPADCVAKESS